MFICFFCSLFGCTPKKENPQNITEKRFEQLNIKSEVANNAIIKTDVSEIQLIGWDLESNKGNNRRFSDMQDEILLLKFRVKNTCVIPLKFFDLFKNEIIFDGVKIDSLQTKFYSEDLKERIYSDFTLEKNTEKIVCCCLNSSSDKKHEIDVSVFYPFSSYLKDTKAGNFEIKIETDSKLSNPINVKIANKEIKPLEIKDYANYKTYCVGSGITSVLDKSSIHCEYENYPYYILSMKTLNLNGYEKHNPILDVCNFKIIYDYDSRTAYEYTLKENKYKYLDTADIAPYNISGFKIAEICFYIKYNKKFYGDVKNQIEELKFADYVYDLSPERHILYNEEIRKKSNIVKEDISNHIPKEVKDEEKEENLTVANNDKKQETVPDNDVSVDEQKEETPKYESQLGSKLESKSEQNNKFIQTDVIDIQILSCSVKDNPEVGFLERKYKENTADKILLIKMKVKNKLNASVPFGDIPIETSLIKDSQIDHAYKYLYNNNLEYIDTFFKESELMSKSEAIIYYCVNLEKQYDEIKIDFFNMKPNDIFGGYLKSNKVDSISLR